MLTSPLPPDISDGTALIVTSVLLQTGSDARDGPVILISINSSIFSIKKDTRGDAEAEWPRPV